ncbi:MAG: hypothetical protein Q9180_008516 [Flavoplaca navasiana]
MRTKREGDFLPGETECSAHKHIHRLASSSYDRITAIGGEDLICELILLEFHTGQRGRCSAKVLHRKLHSRKTDRRWGVMVGPEAPEEWPTHAPIFDVIGELSEFFEARVSRCSRHCEPSSNPYEPNSRSLNLSFSFILDIFKLCEQSRDEIPTVVTLRSTIEAPATSTVYLSWIDFLDKPPTNKPTMTARSLTPPPLQGPTAKEKKYDRQLRLWAASGQQALEDAHVLLINHGGPGVVGVETLKNLILPGIGSYTIVDGNTVAEQDLGINFFLTDESLGR